MNLVILVFLSWIILDIDIFRQVEAEMVKVVSSFLKFYVSAILVELLGGIIYIVHSVYSEKFS